MFLIIRILKGLCIKRRRSSLRLCDMSLIYYIEFAGIHTDPFFRFGGNRNPKLDVRFLKSDVSDKCAFGLQELQPSFPPSLHPGSGSSSRSFKAINKGHVTPAQVNPRRQMTVTFHIQITQIEAPVTRFLREEINCRFLKYRVSMIGSIQLLRRNDGPGRRL